MSKYKVTVWASYETEIEADNQDAAESIAAEEAPFPWADYCDTEEI